MKGKFKTIFTSFVLVTCSFAFVGCGETKPIEIKVSDLKTQFASNEDFSMGEDAQVTLKFENESDVVLDTTGLEYDHSALMATAEKYKVDYSDFNKAVDGQYTIVVIYIDGDEDDSNDISVTYEVTVGPVANAWSVTPSITNWVYGQTAATPAGTPEYGTAVIEYKLKNADDSTYSTNVPTNVGEYTMRVSVAAAPTYTALSTTVDFEITKATNEWIAQPQIAGWAYGEDASIPAAQAKFGNVTYKYKLASEPDTAFTTQVPTAAGSYVMRATVENTDNFTGLTADVNFTISKANALWVTTPSISGWTYGEDANTPIGAANQGTVEFKYKKVGDNEFVNSLPLNGGNKVDAGNYIMLAVVPGNDSYNELRLEVPFTIEKASVIAPVAPEAQVYTGSAIVSGLVSTADYTVSEDEMINAGTYEVTLTLTNPTNYKWSTGEAGADKVIQFEITRAANEWTVEPTMSGWTYGEDAVTPNAESAFGTVTFGYKVKNADDSTISQIAPTNAGAYTLVVIVEESQNYQGLRADIDFEIERVANSWVVEPAISSWTYGEEAPAVQAEAEFGEVSVYYKEAGAEDSTLTATQPVDSGEYTMVVIVEETQNYAGLRTYINFTIAKVDNEWRTLPIMDGWEYGSQPSEFRGEAIYGEITFKIALGGGQFASEFPTNEDGFVEAGTYSVYAEVAEGRNYNRIVAMFNVTVSPKEIIAPTDAGSKVYTGEALLSDLIDTDEYTVEQGEYINAGEHYVTLTLTDTRNTKWADSDNVSIEIPFTITQAENEWVSEPSIADFAYGEDASPEAEAIFGSVEFLYKAKDADDSTLTDAQPADAGEYTLVAIVYASDNYAGLESRVDFTISKADPVDYEITQESVMGDLVAGTVLSELELPSEYSWVNAEYELVEGNNEVEVLYTPVNANFNEKSFTMVIYAADASKSNFTVSADLMDGADITVTNQEINYGENVPSAVEQLVTLKEGLSSENILWYSEAVGDYVANFDAISTAGVYELRFMVIGNESGDYYTNYNPYFGTVTLTINKIDNEWIYESLEDIVSFYGSEDDYIYSLESLKTNVNFATVEQTNAQFRFEIKQADQDDSAYVNYEDFISNYSLNDASTWLAAGEYEIRATVTTDNCNAIVRVARIVVESAELVIPNQIREMLTQLNLRAPMGTLLEEIDLSDIEFEVVLPNGYNVLCTLEWENPSVEITSGDNLYFANVIITDSSIDANSLSVGIVEVNISGAEMLYVDSLLVGDKTIAIEEKYTSVNVNLNVGESKTVTLNATEGYAYILKEYVDYERVLREIIPEAGVVTFDITNADIFGSDMYDLTIVTSDKVAEFLEYESVDDSQQIYITVSDFNGVDEIKVEVSQQPAVINNFNDTVYLYGIIDNITLKMEDGYTGEILLNGQALKTGASFNENVFNIGINTLTVIVSNDEEEVVGYVNYTIELSNSITDLVEYGVNESETESDYSDDIKIVAADIETYYIVLPESDSELTAVLYDMNGETPTEVEGNQVTLKSGYNSFKAVYTINGVTLEQKIGVYRLLDGETIANENDLTHYSLRISTGLGSWHSSSLSYMDRVEDCDLSALSVVYENEDAGAQITYADASNDVVKVKLTIAGQTVIKLLTVKKDAVVVDDNVGFTFKILDMSNGSVSSVIDLKALDTDSDKVVDLGNISVMDALDIKAINPSATLELKGDGIVMSDGYYTTVEALENTAVLTITSSDKTKTETWTVNFYMEPMTMFEIRPTYKEGLDTDPGALRLQVMADDAGMGMQFMGEIKVDMMTQSASAIANLDDYAIFDSEGNEWTETAGDKYVKLDISYFEEMIGGVFYVENGELAEQITVLDDVLLKIENNKVQVAIMVGDGMFLMASLHLVPSDVVYQDVDFDITLAWGSEEGQSSTHNIAFSAASADNVLGLELGEENTTSMYGTFAGVDAVYAVDMEAGAVYEVIEGVTSSTPSGTIEISYETGTPQGLLISGTGKLAAVEAGTVFTFNKLGLPLYVAMSMDSSALSENIANITSQKISVNSQNVKIERFDAENSIDQPIIEEITDGNIIPLDVAGVPGFAYVFALTFNEGLDTEYTIALQVIIIAVGNMA